MTDQSGDGPRYRITIECDPMWGGEALEQMQPSAELIVDGEAELGVDNASGRAIIKFVATDPAPFQQLTVLKRANGVVCIEPA